MFVKILDIIIVNIKLKIS